MKIEVSNGEIVDKYSILTIKIGVFKDTALENVYREYHLLFEHFKQILTLPDDFDDLTELLEVTRKLFEVNASLWQVEDEIRAKERDQIFDDEFVRLARSIYALNDERGRLKRRINELTNSELIEEKSYTNYRKDA